MKKVFVSFWVEEEKAIRNMVLDLDIEDLDADKLTYAQELIGSLYCHATDKEFRDVYIISWKVL